MAKVERSIKINATAQQMEVVSLDANRLHEWFVGVESAEVEGSYPQPGSKVHQKYKAAGMSFNITSTVLSYVAGDHLRVSMEGMISGTQEWKTTPDGSGIKLTAVFDYEVPGGGLGKMLDKLVIERTNTSNLEQSLENLKKLVEK